MFKTIVARAMLDFGIRDADEALKAIEFVEQILKENAQQVETDEPHATRTVKEMMIAKSRVTDLYHDVCELNLE